MPTHKPTTPRKNRQPAQPHRPGHPGRPRSPQTITVTGELANAPDLKLIARAVIRMALNNAATPDATTGTRKGEGNS